MFYNKILATRTVRKIPRQKREYFKFKEHYLKEF